MRRLFIALLFVFLLSACNNSTTKTTEAPASKTTDASAAPAAESPASTAGGDATRIRLTLEGGSNAGIYSATSAEPTCSSGLTGEKSFGNQYSVKGKGDNEFSSLQLIVDDYDAAKSGTDKFYIKVAFGKILQGKSYEVNGSDNSMAGKKTGSGKLTVKESGGSKTATVEGKTADGVSINATITCTSVVTANGVK